MSLHEKEGNKKMPIPRQEVIDYPIPTSLFILFKKVLSFVLKLHHQYPQMTEQLNIKK